MENEKSTVEKSNDVIQRDLEAKAESMRILNDFVTKRMCFNVI